MRVHLPIDPDEMEPPKLWALRARLVEGRESLASHRWAGSEARVAASALDVAEVVIAEYATVLTAESGRRAERALGHARLLVRDAGRAAWSARHVIEKQVSSMRNDAWLRESAAKAEQVERERAERRRLARRSVA